MTNDESRVEEDAALDEEIDREIARMRKEFEKVGMSRPRRFLLAALAGMLTMFHSMARREFLGISGFSYPLEGVWPLGVMVAFVVWFSTPGPAVNLLDRNPARTASEWWGHGWSSIRRVIGIYMCVVASGPTLHLVGFFEAPTYLAFQLGVLVIAIAGLVASVYIIGVLYVLAAAALAMLRRLLSVVKQRR